MNHLLMKLVTHKKTSFIFALLSAPVYWHISTAHQLHFLTLKIPILFYDVAPSVHVEGDETVSLTVEGTRNALFSLAPNEIAVHIDGKKLNGQKCVCSIQPEMVMLPSSVRYVGAVPGTVSFRAQEIISGNAHEEA